MILDDMTVQNFGLFANRQTIKLTPPAPKKPLILFGGLNGAGKTTLLDALQLCLFGPSARISNRGSLAYSEYLSRCIHNGSVFPEAAVGISFRHTAKGVEEHYRLHRSWRRTNGVCKEQFEVIRNGEPESALARNWASQVEDFFPANIAHLFLFDGEQIEGYASQEDSSALVGTAIQNLLGLDIVDQLEKDLRVYERRKRSEDRDDPYEEEIVAAEAELRDLRSQAITVKQERASLKTHQIDRRSRALKEVEDKYQRLGGKLYEQRVTLESYLTTAEGVVKEGAAVLRNVAAGPLPLLLVRELLESTESRDHHEEECRRARELFEELSQRDRDAIEYLQTQSTDKKVVDTLRAFFDQDLVERQSRSKEETTLDLVPEVRNDLNTLLRGDLDKLKEEAVTCLKQQKKAEANADRARLEFQNVPSEDIIAEIASERDILKKEIATLEAKYDTMGQEVERLQRNIERKEQSLMRLIEEDAKYRGDREDRVRILRHAAKVRTTLGEFRRAVIGCHIRRIEQLVLESYQQLLRKESFVTRLSIDPASFSLTLFGRDGRVLSAEQLSAGERQLLAIALLWGMAKASGRLLPTAIDTPLGRLDTYHRTHLVERYLPFASHQVLLLSTDEEIAGDYLERLRPWIGRSYQLAYDDKVCQTQVVPGYFKPRGST